MPNRHIILSLLIVIYLYRYDTAVYTLPDKAFSKDWNANYNSVCKDVDHDRYTKLKKLKWYVAINLHNSEDVIPFLTINIQKLIEFNPNLFLSIYESGSSDKTKPMLKKLKESLNIRHEIVLGNEYLTGDMNRIDFLVDKRNKALKFISKDYDSILFINDIFFCINDILELEYQRILNSAGIVGGMDYEFDENNDEFVFHDTWVAIDMNGYHLNKDLSQPMSSFMSKMSWLNQVPLQVLCVFNGMVAIDIEPFLNGLEFRRGTNDPNTIVAGECSTSECTSLCIDFIKLGYNHVLVPRVKVAYSFNVFKSMKVDNSVFKKYYPPNLPFKPQEDQPVSWSSYPSSFHCHPYFTKDHGWHPHPYAEYWESMPKIKEKE